MADQSTKLRSSRLTVLAVEIRQAHADSTSASIRATERARDAGHGLIEAKELLAHGQWLPWVETLGISHDTTARYMRLAGLDEANFARVRNLGIKAAVESLAKPRRADPPAARGQPLRDGPDFWPTPDSLIHAAGDHVVPALPGEAEIWECACGDGRLGRGIGATAFTDKYPPCPGGPLDFLTDLPPRDDLIAFTNPPFNAADEFLRRGLELLDAGKLRGLVLLLRHDHFMASGKVDALNRAILEVHCNWRPTWIPDTEGNPRWGFAWVYWGEGDRRPPLYIREGTHA